jgi:hypothetical protein
MFGIRRTLLARRRPALRADAAADRRRQGWRGRGDTLDICHVALSCHKQRRRLRAELKA